MSTKSPAEIARDYFAEEPAALSITVEHRTHAGRLTGWYIITRSGRITHVGGINDDLSNLNERERFAMVVAENAARREEEWGPAQNG